MRIRRVAAALAVFAVLATIGAYVAFRQLGDRLSIRLPPASHACVVNAGGASVTAPVNDGGPQALALDAEQVANAATITAAGIRRGVPHRGLVVALATAWQESKLVNLAGGDRDSIGLFQQRPSQGWGRPEQIADQRYAANAFYTGLLKVRGWQDMRVTDAAQRVQRSAHPEAYEKWVDESEILAKALSGNAVGAVACTVSGDPASRGPQAAQTLVSSVRLDWGDVGTTDVSDLVGLALPAHDERVGWQYAHWLVAHAQAHAVKRVRFGDQEWTARSGAWTRKPESHENKDLRVVAEVF